MEAGFQPDPSLGAPPPPPPSQVSQGSAPISFHVSQIDQPPPAQQQAGSAPISFHISDAKPVAPTSSASGALTPAAPPPPDATLLANPAHEGTYKMIAPDGSTVSVPYSKVGQAHSAGYGFEGGVGSQEQARFSRDVAADPQLSFGQQQLLRTQVTKNPGFGGGAPDPALTAKADPKEGTYQMRAPDGSVVAIPYSKVSQAHSSGYGFVGGVSSPERRRFSRDVAADPKLSYLVRENILDMATNPPSAPEEPSYHAMNSEIPGFDAETAGNYLKGAAKSAAQVVNTTAGAIDWLDNKLAHATGATGPDTNVRGSLTAAEEKIAPGITHPLANFDQGVGATAEQLAEWLYGEGEARAAFEALPAAQKAKKLLEGAEFLKNHPTLTKAAAAGLQGMAGGTAQSLAHGATGQEALESGAIAGGVGGGLTGATSFATEVVPEALRAAGRRLLNLSPRDTEALVQKIADTNQAAMDAHMQDVADIQAKNTARDQAYQARVDKAKGDAAANAAEAQQMIADAQAADTQRGQLSQQVLQLSNRINQRIKDVRASVKGVVDQKFDQLRGLIDDVPGQQEVLAQEQFQKPFAELTPEQQVSVTASVKPKTTPLDPLVATVQKVRAKYLRGSIENNSLLDGILQRAQTDAADTSYKDELARQLYGVDYADIDPEKYPNGQAIIDSGIEKYQQQYGADRANETDEAEGIDFHHLRGLSSDLGRAAYNTQDAALKSALLEVKKTIDQGMIPKLAGKYMPKLNTAKQYYSVFKSFFDEPTGASGSGSRVAQSVDAADDYNAAKPFLDTQQSVYKRARQMLVGSAVGSTPHYDPGAGDLVDQLRAAKFKLDKLPSEDQTAKAIEANKQKLAEAQQAVLTPPERQAGEQTQPIPSLPDFDNLTPEALTQYRLNKALTKLVGTPDKPGWTDYSKANISQITGGAASLIGGIISMFAHAAPWLTESATLTGLSAIGWGAGSPYLAELLANPKVLNELVKPTINDFKRVMILPESQRTGVAEAMAELEKRAQQAGKISTARTPWQNFARTVLPAAASAGARQAQAMPQQSGKQGGATATAPQLTNQQLIDSLQHDLNQAQGVPPQ